MGLLVGDVAGFGPSTWGALRSIIYNRSISGSPLDGAGPHNASYGQGFKTTEGNGLIRTDYGYLYLNYGTGFGPSFSLESISDPDCRFSSYYETSSSGMITNEDRAQLVGESVSYSGGGLTIDASAFVGPYYQDFSFEGDPTPIYSIGKLTAF